MKPRTRPLIAVSIALLIVGILGGGAYAASASLGQSELRPEAGQEVDRDIPSSKSKSNAPRIVPGQASSISGSNAGSSGFTGLTFQDQRTVDNGNQTSDTPPDQGLCVGNGRVIEPVNTVFAIYSTSGQAMGGPVSLTQFFTGQHEIDRTVDPPTFGPFLSDPRCYYDPDAKQFVMTILQLPFDAQGNFFNGKSHILIAVSKNSTPTTSTADWRFLAIDGTDDGTVADDGSGRTLPSHPGCPCFGDQPLLGADKYGIYITTNEFSTLGTGVQRRPDLRDRQTGADGRHAQVPGDPGRADSVGGRTGLLAPACSVSDRRELEHGQQRNRVSALGARLQRDNRQPDRGLGADEHQVTRLDAGRHVDESRDPRQRDVRPAAERRAEEGTDPARRISRRAGGAARDERRPHEPGRLRRRQVVERRQHHCPNVERSELTDRSEWDRVLHRDSLDTVRNLGRGNDREAGLRRARKRRQRHVPVDRGQRRR